MKNAGWLCSIINHLLPSASEQTHPETQNSLLPWLQQHCTYEHNQNFTGTLPFHFKSIPLTNICWPLNKWSAWVHNGNSYCFHRAYRGHKEYQQLLSCCQVLSRGAPDFKTACIPFLTSIKKPRMTLPKEAEFSPQVDRGRKTDKRICKQNEREGLSTGQGKVLRR